jgi:excisionase family DNA binding protein
VQPDPALWRDGTFYVSNPPGVIMGDAQPLETRNGDRLRDLAHVQARLNQSRSSLYELFARNELASVKLGRRRMVRESDLQAFIASLGGE